MFIALAILLLSSTPTSCHGLPVSRSPQGSKDESGGWRSNGAWLTDFDEASRQAQLSKKLILAYFPSRAWPGFNDPFEATTLANKKFPALARNYVLLVQDRMGTLDGLPPGARAAEEPSQSILILDADGWALGRCDASTDQAARTPPLLSQLESMTKPAQQRKALRERVAKGDARARMEWLTWIAGSGQLTDMEQATAELDALGVKASSSRRDEIEVGVIINAAQASANATLQKATKEVRGATGSRLLQYFTRGYRPSDSVREWSYLWSLLQGAEDAGDPKLYEELVGALKKNGACGDSLKNIQETLAHLKSSGQ